MQKLFILCSLLLFMNSEIFAKEQMQKDTGFFQSTVSNGIESARNWASRVLCYGQTVINNAQSVEMLPYRYVFLTSFLGGLTAVFCMYVLQRAAYSLDRGNAADIFAAHKRFYARPTTFRHTLTSEDPDEIQLNAIQVFS